MSHFQHSLSKDEQAQRALQSHHSVSTTNTTAETNTDSYSNAPTAPLPHGKLYGYLSKRGGEGGVVGNKLQERKKPQGGDGVYAFSFSFSFSFLSCPCLCFSFFSCLFSFFAAASAISCSKAMKSPSSSGSRSACTSRLATNTHITQFVYKNSPSGTSPR